MSRSKYYYWRKKGKQAMERGLYREGEYCFTQSLKAAREMNNERQMALSYLNITACQVELSVEDSEALRITRAHLSHPEPLIAYLAAYHLARLHEKKGDQRKALFYANLALHKAQFLKDTQKLGSTYMLMGNMLVATSRFSQAAFYYQKAIDTLPLQKNSLLGAILLDNTGYCEMMLDHITEGIHLCERALALLPQEAKESAYASYMHLDLCYGYLEAHDPLTAEKHGQKALELARRFHQEKLVRNSLLLLGECAMAQQKIEEAQCYFGQVASYYPEVKMGLEVMMGVRLTRMINLRA